MISNEKKYVTEASKRWGNTDAYCEHEKKTKNYTNEKWSEINKGLTAIFAEFGEHKKGGFASNSPEVQSLVVKLQEYITQNYYTCTDEILAGLGQIYVCDERFKKNIDKYGEGTSIYVAQAIAKYAKHYSKE